MRALEWMHGGALKTVDVIKERTGGDFIREGGRTHGATDGKCDDVWAYPRTTDLELSEFGPIM